MAGEREALFRRFYGIIDETTELFDLLITFENKKLDAIAANDVELLERHMHDEQAFLMKLRGLDRKRESLQLELGFEGMTFAQIIDSCQGEEKELLRMRNEALSAKTSVLKAAVGSTRKYIELHLHSLDILLQKLEQEEQPYDRRGEKSAAEPAARFKPTKA